MRFSVVALAVLACFGVTAAQCAPPSARNPCLGQQPPTRWKHVVVITYENRDVSEVFGNRNAPYANWLLHKCAKTSNWRTLTHPSLPNYFASTFGTTFGITDDRNPPAHTTTADNVFREVRRAGLTVKTYEESMPINCYRRDADPYVVHHNPEAYTAAPRDRFHCATSNVPTGSNASTSGRFLHDLQHDTLPDLAYLEPNNDHNTHNTHDTSVHTGDRYAATLFPKILNSRAYQHGRLAVLWVWDESGGGNTQPGIVVAPSVKPGTNLTTAITHYNLLRTLLDMLGIHHYPGHATNAASLRTSLHI